MDGPDEARVTAKFHWDGSPVDLSAYSGIRFWVRGAGQFRLRTLQPTINDWDDYSASYQHADPSGSKSQFSFVTCIRMGGAWSKTSLPPR